MTLILCLFSTMSFAQSLLIRAPQAPVADYMEFLQNNSNYISPENYALAKIRKNPTQESAIFQVGDSCAVNLSHCLERLDELQSRSPLTPLSLMYLRDLGEKVLSGKISASERQGLLQIYCKAGSLLLDRPLLHPCHHETVSIQSIQIKFPWVTKILIESSPVDVFETVTLKTGGVYHWTLLSDSQKPLHFYGSFSELLNQPLVGENFVTGDCSSHAADSFELNTLGNYSVFFSSGCIANGRRGETNSSSFKEKKTWLYVLGAAALAGLAYSLKDKHLLIQTTR